MARKSNLERVVVAGIAFARRSPRHAALLLLVAVLVGVIYLASRGCSFIRSHPTGITGDGRPGEVFFCSWNVENFYDDQDDPSIHDDMENWFGTDAAAYRQKVDHLAEGLLKMNGGVGPDIACLYEVENERCMTALRDAVNAKLSAAGMADRAYANVVMQEDSTGRHFAPGVLTRLNVVRNRTRKLGGRKNGRILESHMEVNGYELIVIAAHWTSRVSDDAGKGDRRLSYANDCYGRARAILTENADADVIVCGDFNDEFTDRSIRDGLRASNSSDEVRGTAAEPRLLDLFANWAGDPPGTIYGKSHWSVFDHICVTRGLLDDQGWSCDVPTAAIFAAPEMRTPSRRGRFEPFRFGNQKASGPRGYSDHFPVTVMLKVAGSAAP